MDLISPHLPDIDSPETACAGAHAVFKLRTRWHLTWAQLARLLGVRSESTLQNWTSRVPESLAPDVLDRMGYLIAIFYALEQIRGGERSEQWLRAPNAGSPFFGRPPLDYMLGGRMTDIVETYRYLKGVATGAF
jgi:single-stranded DNA-specific DHH superfamily exonuclease